MKWVVITMWTMAAIVAMFGSGSITGSWVGLALLFGGVFVCDLDAKRKERAERQERRRMKRHLRKFNSKR